MRRGPANKMTRISTILAALLFICPEPSRAGINTEFKVICDSGSVDTATNFLPSATDAACREACTAEQCDKGTTMEAADTCLRAESLFGCLFDVNQMKGSDPKWCVTQHKEDKAVALSIVASISKDTLHNLGNGSMVNAIFLRVDVDNQNTTCTHKEVYVGHSLDAKDDKCTYGGGPDIQGLFGLGDSNDVLVVTITDMLEGLIATNQDVVIWAELKNPDCQLKVKNVDVVFSMKYQTGFSSSVECKAASSCETCLANGCSWCDWSRFNYFMPEWLFDWEWLNSAREKNKGACGTSSATCAFTWGKLNPCGASSTMSAMGAVAAATAIMITSGERF